ncbi:UDP-4-amino-4,6-dideoxy-N-acetyl-beta-L-altrosamine N-acetyltransferase [Limnohabitans sp. 2KL-51]|uniref:UDP-4-amino-4, 6-dideoxy-N-acetyl-beta-L-altrosamine N-acetyltransferase n=1 Tax=Limnohabitans sp. 2KL-51 TaxID=1977911 RepID=UPI001E61C1CB|nr:UDP-4-amino-4,6-dideoxy-N-acetyl-beta-L-altrosamine N-acetyltransferase [Limnohabitans sp. 2KL-51]
MTENLLIRSMIEDDLPMVLAWRNHPEVRRYMFTHHEISLAEHTQWFMRAVQDNARRLLIVQEQGSPIGYVQFSNVEPGGVADWGFYARPEAAKGTGSKLGASALEHAFGQLKLHKVCGQAIDTNQASIRFHERLGFKREGVLRDQKRMNEQYQTLICFGLLAHEWQAHTQGT